MGEVSGVVIVKVNNDWFKGLKNQKLVDVGALAKGLVKSAGLPLSVIGDRNLAIRSSNYKGGYFKFEYENSDWRDICSELLIQGKGIELFSRHGNDEGSFEFFALSKSGHKQIFEYHEDANDSERIAYVDSIKDAISCLKIIPAGVKKAFPKLIEYVIELKERLLTDMGVESEADIDFDFKRYYLNCAFYPKLDKQEIHEVYKHLPEDFTDVEIYEYDEPEYTNIHWNPISKKKGRTAKDLLMFLSKLCDSDIYAYKHSRGEMRPYTLYNANKGLVKVVLRTSDYSDEELTYWSESLNEKTKIPVMWGRFDFENVHKFFSDTDINLKNYITQSLEKYSSEIQKKEELAKIKKREKKERLKNKRIEDGISIVPILSTVELIIDSRNGDTTEIDSIVEFLELRGANIFQVSRYDKFPSTKDIFVNETTIDVGNWLIENISQLNSHSLHISKITEETINTNFIKVLIPKL